MATVILPGSSLPEQPPITGIIHRPALSDLDAIIASALLATRRDLDTKFLREQIPFTVWERDTQAIDDHLALILPAS